MEIKAYLKFLKKRWWIIISVLILTLGSTAWITRNMKPVYEATATYIVRLSVATVDEKSRINALALLTGNPEIPATYAKVASSRQIKDLAAQQLGLASRKNLSVSAQVIAGTNVLEITVSGNDPALVAEYANAIGAQTISYTHTLYETFELAPLDAATRPNSPVLPNVTTNMSLGAILGLALGFILALLIENLSASAIVNEPLFNILDEKSGLYNQKYFILRLKEELSRAQRTKRAFSVALLKLEAEESNEAYALQPGEFEEIVSLLKSHLHEDEIPAILEKNEVVILLPDAHGKEARERIVPLLQAFSESDLATGFQMMASIVTYEARKAEPDITPHTLLEQLKAASNQISAEKAAPVSAEQKTIPTPPSS